VKSFEFDGKGPKVDKEIQRQSIKKMGLKSDKPQYVQHMEELRESPPNIVIAEGIRCL